MKIWVALVLGLILSGGAPGASAKSLAMAHAPKAVKAYVAGQLRYRMGDATDVRVSRLTVAQLPDVAKRHNYLVFVTGGGWCGATGNCTILVVEQAKAGFKIIGEMHGHEPIHLLVASSHAHRDLAISVHVSAWDNYDFRWRFNGSTYVGGEPLNGYVLDTARQSKTGEQESRKLPYKPEGPLLIGSEDKGELLFAN
ncbi:MAG: hypothetical protein ACTHLA_05115 [Asticcacaulis sp.]|uniref:hypothetical protein n=1 Tax=Asticcacaulis sp. TaxID=1872648 RepID=UPI003F7CA7D9